MVRSAGGIILALLLSLGAVACSGSAEESSQVDGGAGSADGDDSGLTTTGERGAPLAARPAPLGAAPLPSLGASIVKTAQLELEVDDGSFADSYGDVVAIADEHGGFLTSSKTEGDSARRGHLVLRIPSEAFELALTELRELGRVVSEGVSGRDVSEEFIDLEARLRHLRAQERVLLDLMREAVSIADTINVQRELEGIQLEIERIRGRLRFLGDRTSLGTITVDLQEAGAEPATAGALERAWGQAVAVSTSVVSALIVGTGALLPLAILGLVVFVAVRLVRPRLGRT